MLAKRLENDWCLRMHPEGKFFYAKPVIGGELMITKVSEIHFNRLFLPDGGKPVYWDRIVILNPISCKKARAELDDWWREGSSVLGGKG